MPNIDRLFARLRVAAGRLAKRHGIVAKSNPEMNTPALDEAIDLTPQPLKGAESKLGGGNNEAAALRALVNGLNTPQAMEPNQDPLKINRRVAPEIQAETDAILRGGATLVQGVPPTPAPVAHPQSGFLAAPVDFTRTFFTGRLFAGKDHCADAAGYVKVGLADPIYSVVSKMTGVEITSTKGKDVPGIRALLQAVGQYGRGTVSAQYPWTMTRIIFLDFVKALFPDLWAMGYGQKDSFWIERFMETVDALGAGARVACTNVRFKNEFDELRGQGFQHWHVMTSAAEWNARLAAKGMNAQSKELNDVSEEFAKGVDKEIAGKLRVPGGKLRCIWNSNTPVPSPRLYSVAEFVARVNTAPEAQPSAQADVFTGE